MMLYSDDLRITMRSALGGRFGRFGTGVTSSYVDFTVHCGDGYQLDFHEQFNVSPRAFGGGKVTSPVSETILIGNYRFWGTRNGQATPDAGLYLASPSSRFAKLRSF
jgi:hypothetical protein